MILDEMISEGNGSQLLHSRDIDPAIQLTLTHYLYAYLCLPLSLPLSPPCPGQRLL